MTFSVEGIERLDEDSQSYHACVVQLGTNKIGYVVKLGHNLNVELPRYTETSVRIYLLICLVSTYYVLHNCQIVMNSKAANQMVLRMARGS